MGVATSPEEFRDSVLQRLQTDLVGPLQQEEVLDGETARPSDIYLTGILWPLGERMNAEDDDGADAGEDENDPGSTSATVVGQQRPCVMGISLCLVSETPICCARCTVRFATYVHVVDEAPDGTQKKKWRRKQWEFSFDSTLPGDSFPITLRGEGLAPHVELHARILPSERGLLTTFTLINRSEIKVQDRDDVERLLLFQTEIAVSPGRETKIAPRPPLPGALDGDEESSRLLYRNCLDFGAGHQCSVTWEAEGSSASIVRSSWIPSAVVPAYRADGADVFAPIVKEGVLKAEDLARIDGKELRRRLELLVDAYGRWIEERSGEVKDLPKEYQETANRHMENCRSVFTRLNSGVQAIGSNKIMRKAFQYANAAMALQHSWKRNPAGDPLPPLGWRPFQLGFILLAAESVCHPDSPERDVLDLLWFPTGGGKTEAYMALIAMLAWHRRLSQVNPDDGAGNVALMRYTLRLLTAQQFDRACALVLACELIRKGLADPRRGKSVLGTIPFSIGLWVGEKATPNRYKDAKHAKTNGGSTAEQIKLCPACREHLTWHYDDQNQRVRPVCENEKCALGGSFGVWPVCTVDDDIYRQRPTLVVGTVDKFARIPLNPDMKTLFGFGTEQSPDLIIQDELHLISGPLGTMVGLYETAFDWLLRKGGRRPKVIGSTATIRRAEEQIRAIFDRRSCQFPAPGLSCEDSGFAVVDRERPGRLYVGVTTAGRSAKFALQAVIGSLLQSGGPHDGVPDDVRDGYATLLCYFNSLRELGGAIVQMLDDVPDSIKLYASQRGEEERSASMPRELTSRASQEEILEILSDLTTYGAGDPNCVDAVLATNMVSVGVDVPRLALMAVNGQPKTRSEYIQSTSRVGRSGSPGLVVDILNAAKARDRSHYETFLAWHSRLYRDVEATSATPFASRSRDRALRAVLVAMIRHGDDDMLEHPNLENASNIFLQEVVSELERRIERVDPRELEMVKVEIDESLDCWQAMRPEKYCDRSNLKRPLLQSADDHASKIAAGRLSGSAWPVMNSMRSVEPATRFRLRESLQMNGDARRRWRQEK